MCEIGRARALSNLDLGSRLLRGDFTFRYARAGEDLQSGTLVVPDPARPIDPAPEPNEINITPDMIWGNVMAATDIDQLGTLILGWPEADVKKDTCFWLREPLSGSKFLVEE